MVLITTALVDFEFTPKKRPNSNELGLKEGLPGSVRDGRLGVLGTICLVERSRDLLDLYELVAFKSDQTY